MRHWNLSKSKVFKHTHESIPTGTTVHSHFTCSTHTHTLLTFFKQLLKKMYYVYVFLVILFNVKYIFFILLYVFICALGSILVMYLGNWYELRYWNLYNTISFIKRLVVRLNSSYSYVKKLVCCMSCSWKYVQ